MRHGRGDRDSRRFLALWHTQRAATRDVDSANRLTNDVVGAVRRVAARHDLADNWVDDQASMFWPADADFADCTVACQTGGLISRCRQPVSCSP